jgi:hypothetical protein
MTLAGPLQIWEVKPMPDVNPSNAGNPTSGAAGVNTPVGPAPGSAPSVAPSNPNDSASVISLMASLMAQPGDANAGQAQTPTPSTTPGIPMWAWAVLGVGALLLFFRK